MWEMSGTDWTLLPEPIILASASPRRRRILGTFGLPFTVHPAEVNEAQRPGEAPADHAARLAREKADAVARRLDAGTVIAADTIVVLDGRLLGKPNGPEQAEEYLRELRGREHEVFTGVSVIVVAGGVATRTASGWMRTLVRMRDLTDVEIGDYVASGDPLDKAGAYAIQNAAFHPVAEITGSETNVVGLPLELLQLLLDDVRAGPTDPA
jgi:septum formation protein